MIRKEIEYIVESLYGFAKFVILRIREKLMFGNYTFPYNEELIDKKVFVLANGPSLITDLQILLKDEDFQHSRKCVVNFFANTDFFLNLKPEFYVLADVAFWGALMNDNVKSMIEVLNTKVSWQMTLFVVNKGASRLKELITNNSIKIIPISTLAYQGFKSRKYKVYKEGKAVPCFVNVTIMAEFVLLNRGCKDIRLYGVDHTFFNGLAVDKENYACIKDSHFYGDEFRRLPKPGGGYFTMAEWIMDKYLTFKEHENIRGYADYLGAIILNCTECSLIDAYERMKVDDNIND